MSEAKHVPGLTFLEALKTGKPMRRGMMPWIWLGAERENVEATYGVLMTYPPYYDRLQWRSIHTGKPYGLSVEDYTANDWTVMA